MSVRPLKKISRGKWKSRDSSFMFSRGQFGWHVLDMTTGNPEPLNWCREQSTLKDAVNFAVSKK